MRVALFYIYFELSTTVLCAAHFKVGIAKQNITPTKPTLMWGYGARHDVLSTGVMYRQSQWLLTLVKRSWQS